MEHVIQNLAVLVLVAADPLLLVGSVAVGLIFRKLSTVILAAAILAALRQLLGLLSADVYGQYAWFAFVVLGWRVLAAGAVATVAHVARRQLQGFRRRARPQRSQQT